MYAVTVVNNISEWIGKGVRFFLLPLIAVILIDVFLRYVFNAPTYWADESSCYLFGAIWLLGGCYALSHKAHVKMELFYVRLSLRWRAILDLITAPLLFAFTSIVLWKGLESALRSLQILEKSSTSWAPPLYPIKFVIPLAAFLMLLQGLADFVGNFMTAIRGEDRG